MVHLWRLLVCNYASNLSLSDHLKGIPVVIFVAAMIVLGVLRVFAHHTKQAWTSLLCMWHCFPGFRPGLIRIEGQADLGPHWVQRYPSFLAFYTRCSEWCGWYRLVKKTPHSPNHRTDLSIPNPLPAISISSNPPSGLVAKASTEPLESDLMKAFYSNWMKCQLDGSSRGCCRD